MPVAGALLALVRTVVCGAEFAQTARASAAVVEAASTRLDAADAALRALHKTSVEALDSATLKLDVLRIQVDLDEAARVLSGGDARRARAAAAATSAGGSSPLALSPASPRSSPLAAERWERARAGASAAAKERRAKKDAEYLAAKKALASMPRACLRKLA